MAKATTAKKVTAKPKASTAAARKPAAKAQARPAAKKTVKKTAMKPAVSAATEKKEIDKMVAAIKEQAAEMKPKTEVMKKGGLGSIIGAIALIVLVGLVGSLAVKQIRMNKAKASIKETIGKLAGGMVLKEVTEFEEVSGVYKFSFTFEEFEEQPFTSYMTTDGKLFFVEGYEVKDLEGAPDVDEGGDEVSVTSCDEVDKSATPELTAYIVADCPYGTQMQEVMNDAISQAPELVNNMKVRYFFDYIEDDGEVMAMHGEAEALEGMRQICIREEQPARYWDYVSCYAGGRASSTCLSEAGVVVATVDSCMKDINRGIAWAREDDALARMHGVSGSPTLVLNDAHIVKENGFGGRNANGLKSIICCSSDNALPFCSDVLSSATVAASGDCN